MLKVRFRTMVQVHIDDAVLRQAATAGMDNFLEAFAGAIREAIGGELNADNMGELNSDQITLLGYLMLRDSVMDGGFIELIHNGLGEFIFFNPFGKAVREWGLRDLYKLLDKCSRYFKKYRLEIERDCTQEEFDALYERYPEFDDFDDYFVEHEEEFTEAVAQYVDDHINDFAVIDK